MNNIPVKNDTKMTIFVGGTMVPPGETRILPEHQVPAHLRPKPAAPPREEGPDPLLTLLDGTVKEITAAIAELSATDLAKLKAAEEAGNTRKGVMSAIAERELQIADELIDSKAQALQQTADVSQIIAALPSLSKDELLRLEELETEAENPREDLLTALEAAVVKLEESASE